MRTGLHKGKRPFTHPEGDDKFHMLVVKTLSDPDEGDKATPKPFGDLSGILSDMFDDWHVKEESE